jgi:hypothetical protein
VRNLSSNLLFVPKLTQTSKILEFWPDWFYVWDLKIGNSIVVDVLLDLT